MNRLASVLTCILLAGILMGHRPFHFETDPMGSGWTNMLGNAAHWTHAGSIWTCGVGTGEHVAFRDTDTSDDATVDTRVRRDGTVEFGVLANGQNSTTYYTWYSQTSTSKFVIFVRTTGAGFTNVCTYNVLATDLQWYRMRLTTETDGSNKILNAYLDEVLRCGPVTTATQHSNGQGGFVAWPYGTPGDVDHEWFAYDTVMTATDISPKFGPRAGGDSVTITGTNFVDKVEVTIGGVAATNESLSPTTVVTADVPANAAGGSGDVVVGFGTVGSPEYTATITSGYLYRVFGGMGTSGMGF